VLLEVAGWCGCGVGVVSCGAVLHECMDARRRMLGDPSTWASCRHCAERERESETERDREREREKELFV